MNDSLSYDMLSPVVETCRSSVSHARSPSLASIIIALFIAFSKL